MNHTHTYVTIEVSQAAFDEIKSKMEAADYQHALHQDGSEITIDMHGIGLTREPLQKKQEHYMNPNDPALLIQALWLIASHHAGQFDKCGQPFVLHPIRVMVGLGVGASNAARVVALLHDLVEDTGVSLDDLRDWGFPETIIAGVDAMTRRVGEKYVDYIDRVGKNPLGYLVKIADLKDNLDPARIPEGGSKELESLHRRHKKALERIQGEKQEDDLPIFQFSFQSEGRVISSSLTWKPFAWCARLFKKKPAIESQ